MKENIERKVDDVSTDLTHRMEIMQTSVSAVERTLNGNGITHAIAAMQNTCIGQMTSLTTRLDEHVKLAGHPGVTEKIAALEADVTTLKRKES